MTDTARQRQTTQHDTTQHRTTQQPITYTDKATETDTRPTRSKPSHLGITIRGAAPASGRQRAAAAAADPHRPSSMIVSALPRWSGC